MKENLVTRVRVNNRIAIYPSWEIKNQFLPMEWHAAYQGTPGKVTSLGKMDKHNGLHSCYLYCFMYFLIWFQLGGLNSCPCFLFCLFVCFLIDQYLIFYSWLWGLLYWIFVCFWGIA